MTNTNYKAIAKVGETLAYRIEMYESVTTTKGKVFDVVRFYDYDKKYFYFTEIERDIIILDDNFNCITVIEDSLYKSIIEKAIAITAAIIR